MRSTIGLVTAGCLVLAGCAGTDDRVHMPNVVGQRLDQAKKTLESKKLSAEDGSIPADESKCRVNGQQPSAGVALDSFSSVKLKCVVAVPELVGKKADDADSALSNGSLDSDETNPPDDGDLSRCTVSSQSISGEAAPHTRMSGSSWNFGGDLRG